MSSGKFNFAEFFFLFSQIALRQHKSCVFIEFRLRTVHMCAQYLSMRRHRAANNDETVAEEWKFPQLLSRTSKLKLWCTTRRNMIFVSFFLLLRKEIIEYGGCRKKNHGNCMRIFYAPFNEFIGARRTSFTLRQISVNGDWASQYEHFREFKLSTNWNILQRSVINYGARNYSLISC